jgi:hypothetical protein
MLFSTLWDYCTSTKITTIFTPFQLIYGLEGVLLIECENPLLKLSIKLLSNTSIEEEHLLYLARLDDQHLDVALTNETHKKCVKSLYDKSIHPLFFLEGDLVLVYDQDHETLVARKFEPLWHGPYIVKHVFKRGA